MNSLTIRRPRVLFAALFVLAAFLSTAAAPASAGVLWSLDSSHAPAHMPPSGSGQYILQLGNIGDTESDGTPITITDTLPAGLSVQALSDIPSDISNGGATWDCSATVFPATTITCSTSQLVPAPLEDVESRGVTGLLVITVSVAPGLSGSAENQVSVEGGGGPPAAVTDPTEFSSTPAGFGFLPGSFLADLFDAQAPAGSPVRQAGSHPFEMRVDFKPNLRLRSDPDAPDGNRLFSEPEDHFRTLTTRLPAGFFGNPQATATCDPIFMSVPGFGAKGLCPATSQVGSVDLVLQDGKKIQANKESDIPVHNVQPPPGALAAFGFSYLGNPIIIEAKLDPTDDSILATVDGVNEFFSLRAVHLTLWGVPADPAHDLLRVDPDDPNLGETGFNTPSPDPIQPFLTLPSQCDSGASIRVEADSWQNPGHFTVQHGAEIQATGCDDPRIRFRPTIQIQPTSHEAASPTGLDIDLKVPQKPDTFSTSNPERNAANAARLYAGSGDDRALVTPPLRDAITTLPAGMAINPSAADGLAGCSSAQIALHTDNPVACPDASKVGSVDLTTPLLADPVEGSVYLAAQSDNPSASLLGLYVVLADPARGLLIKLPAKVEADPDTGQLTTRFTENPQLPFSDLQLHFDAGSRAPLVNPPTCGTYASSVHLTSWNSSLAPIDTGDSFQITSGPGGSACATTLAGRAFSPAFIATSALPIAGAFSPFAVEASRADGTQELRTIETILPPGLVGRLAGIPYCPESAIAAISSAPGAALTQKLAPSCPATSLIGHTDAAAGAGGLPFHNPGSVYLAGPYKGAPLSVAIVTPILAGPFDLGSIVVRAAIFVDPATARIRVVSDPIPDRIVADGNGFPLNLRSVRVTMDRNQFTLNPTSCDPFAVTGLIGSLQGAVAAVSSRFQVGACKALDFKPTLKLNLKGGTRRSAHPALRVVLTTKPGEANIARAAVTLPHSEFLAQEHIKTICTRVQFAAGQCPKGSIYGKARAFTPLLDKPLEGPVYLRSSSNPLPDLVADLGGQIHVVLAGRIDSVKGGIRNVFTAVPDAPVSKFVLEMQGGKKGLLVNSRNLCRSTNRAKVLLDGQNGKTADSSPVVTNSCGQSGKDKAHRSEHPVR